MAAIDLPGALSAALQHHQAAQFAQAEAIYRQVLALQPRCAEALHLLGTLCGQTGRGEEAVTLLRRAIDAGAVSPELYNDFGNANLEAGRVDDAVAALRRALELRPGYFEAWASLGRALEMAQDFPAALDAFNQAMAIRPDAVNLLAAIGEVHRQSGDLAAAIECSRRVLTRFPEDFTATINLATALWDKGERDEAIQRANSAMIRPPATVEQARTLVWALLRQDRRDDAVRYARRVAQHWPRVVEIHLLLGGLFFELDRLNESVEAYGQALELRPGDAGALTGLGTALQVAGKLDAATDALNRAVALDLEKPEAHQSLACALKDAGKLDQSLAHFRRAMQLQPKSSQIHGDMIYTMHFHADFDAKALLEEHRSWARVHADALATNLAPHQNDRDCDRRLRIGYVSGDFRNHPVGRFLAAPLAAHDHNNFEIFCFSNSTITDATTEHFKRAADRWFNVAGMSDAALAEFIREQKIDILVDLTLHMARNRMLTFARKPAPIQVTYLAYASTSGISTMDYRLTDDDIDPPGEEENYVEESVRLKSYWCYTPPVTADQVAPLPALAVGHITFGCLNNFAKASDEALSTWRRVLDAVPGSRVKLLCGAGRHRGRVVDALGENRVEFIIHMPLEHHLKIYHGIDIGLDAFPYAGGTTTCDALWMGVPVVTLRGKTGLGRGGASIMRQLGLDELVANTTDAYVSAARGLANNQSRLAELRATMRARMKSSRLCDASAFTRDLEEKFRWMWRRWCRP